MSAPTPAPLKEIVELARAYARERDALQGVVDEIQEEQRQAVRARKRSLNAAVARTSSAKDALRAAIAESPQLFEKPRTQTAEGVKFGYRKLPGQVQVADEAKTIERIRSQLPEREEDLIKVRETLVKAAVRNLQTHEAKKIGVTIVETDDEILIATASDDLDKLVKALLPDGENAGAGGAP